MEWSTGRGKDKGKDASLQEIQKQQKTGNEMTEGSAAILESFGLHFSFLEALWLLSMRLFRTSHNPILFQEFYRFQTFLALDNNKQIKDWTKVEERDKRSDEGIES